MNRAEQMAITPDGDLKPVTEFSERDKWWCECRDSRRPHVHCPWGGMHIHVVDLETGETVRDA